MTIADPTLQKFYNHLIQIYNDPYEEPDENLIMKVKDMLRYDALVKCDSSILGQFAPIVLQIINSNQTTSRTKKYAILFLDMVLPYYSYTEINTIFSDELMVKVFQGGDYLKAVLARVLQRADPSKIVHSPLVYELFKTFANPDSDISTVDAVQKAIVALTLKSDEIRQMYLNNTDIINIMIDMKNDKIVQSRLIDLVCEILPVVPSLSTSLYLVSEEELASSHDILFYRFCVGTWRTFLHLIDEHEGLSFLKETMKPQIDFCARKYVGRPTLLDGKEIIIDYDDFGTVYLLITVSFVLPAYFQKLNDKYNIINYSIDTYNRYLKSNRFLTGANTIFLRNQDALFDNFKLTHSNLDIFCHLLGDNIILHQKLKPEKFSKEVFDKLLFQDLLKIFTILSENKDRILKMVNDWPFIIARVINTNIINEAMISSHTLAIYLKEILKSDIPLGSLENPVKERIKQLEGYIEITVQEPLTEAL